MPETRTIPRNPAEWTLEDAKRAFPAPQKASVGAGLGMLYLMGDHFQDGKPWMGAGRDATGSLGTDNLSKVRQTFVCVPESRGCVETRRNAVCGNQPDISIQPVEPDGPEAPNGEKQPGPAQVKYAGEWKRDTSAWWDAKNLWGGPNLNDPTGVRGMVAYASAHPSGSACLRAFINPASLSQDTAPDGSRQIPKQKDRRTALQHIEAGAPSPDRCTVYTDPDTQQKTGIFRFWENDVEYAEIWFSRRKPDGMQETVYKRVGGAEQGMEVVYPLFGYLPIVQANIGTLLTTPVLNLQASIDLAATSLHRLNRAHGFGLRTEINAQETGEWKLTPPPGIDVPQTKTLNDNRTVYLWPTPPELGDSVIRNLTGFEYTSGTDPETGKETFGVTTPAVHYHEPSDPVALINGLNAEIMLLRDACHQGHRVSGLLGSTAEASGDAYEQRRAAHVADITNVAETVDVAVAHFLTAVTLWADYHAGEDNPVFTDEWNVKVQSHPSAGPVSTERENSTIALVDKEIISSEEGTARVGVQDVQAERERIRNGRSPVRRAEIVRAYKDAGADAVASFIEAGHTPKRAEELARTDGEPFVEQ